MDPTTPVLVAAAAASGRDPDGPDGGGPAEAVGLMTRAARAAARRTGKGGNVLGAVDRIVVPRGTWGYPDPGRLLAHALGCPGATSVLADLGVLQSGLVNAAAADVAAGRARLVLVAGGEARHRAVQAQRSGAQAPETAQDPGALPDEVLRPAADVLHPVEVRHRLVQAVEQYAILETATRNHDGQDVVEHRRVVAELWAACNRTAGTNPQAWNPAPMSAEALATPSPGNRPLAFPYCKWHVTQWNVDLAAALLLTTVGTARELGLDESGWVFPLAGADSDHMVPVVARGELWRAPGIGHAGDAALAAAGIDRDRLDVVDLYSCFPIAVRLQARALGLDDGRALTVGGGMAFAGGPFNNAVLQATVRAAELLAGRPGSCGLVTAVSGMLTKQGLTIWSASPPAPAPFRRIDVTSTVAGDTPELPVHDEVEGPGTVAGYTVRYAGDEPVEGVLVVDLDAGGRSIGVVRDAGAAAELVDTEGCGRRVHLGAGGTARLG